MRVFILEDDHTRIEAFLEVIDEDYHVDIATTVEAAKREWKPPYDLVLLDHDLGGEQMVKSGDNTGFEFATWIADKFTEQETEVIVHSWNPDGALNMIKALDHKVIREPFGASLLKYLKTRLA